MAKTSSDKYPAHAYPNARAFKSEKRKQLREVLRAMEQLRSGCAYFPNGHQPVVAIKDQLEALAKELSAKEWGR